MRLKNIRYVAAVATAVLLFAVPAGAATILGQIGTNDTLLNGRAVYSGTTLMTDTTVQTRDQGAIIHLLNGNAIHLAANSKVFFGGAPDGVALEVLAGLMLFSPLDGVPLEFGINGVLILNAKGQVQEGTRVAQGQLNLCDLNDSSTGQPFTDQASIEACQANPKGGTCSWTKIAVDEAVSQSYLDHGAVVIGENSEIDDLCQDVPPAGGLSTGAKWGIGLGAAAAGYGIYELIEDDGSPS